MIKKTAISISSILFLSLSSHGLIKPQELDKSPGVRLGSSETAVVTLPFAKVPEDANRMSRPYLSEIEQYEKFKLKKEMFGVIKVRTGKKQRPIKNRKGVKIWAKSLARLNVEQLDQLYARLTSGPIPNGHYQGVVAIAKGGTLDGAIELAMKGSFFSGFLRDFGRKFVKLIAESAWEGKHFYKDKRELRNYIKSDGFVMDKLSDLGLVNLKDQNLVNSLNNGDTATVNGIKYWLRFPAKLYCGQSLMDSRRESIIIDYAYGRDASFDCSNGDSCTERENAYIPVFDGLADKNGLTFRDEIRMVRPGLYLGRGYINRIFGLYFILYSEKDAKAYAAGDREHAQDECRVGSQRLRQAKGGKTNIWQ